MSARSKLIRLARENTPDYSNHVPCDPETGFVFIEHDEYVAHFEKLLDEYAHELAEQQRTEMRAPGRSHDASRWNRCVGMTADLIDPHKESST